MGRCPHRPEKRKNCKNVGVALLGDPKKEKIANNVGAGLAPPGNSEEWIMNSE